MSGKNCCGGEISDCASDGRNRIFSAASSKLTFTDYLGSCKARLGVGRMNYAVEPGLYAIGEPDKNSPVLVSANYKLTFDALRKNLSGLDCWLLILDTKGVNVWCAAGKGTFGTEELISRVEKSRISEIVAHRRLILPQLGAPGVNANEVSRRSGFSVTFGPVRASDIKQFVANGFKVSPGMRTVKFTTLDRLVLTPVELVAAARASMPFFGALFFINLFAARPFGIYDSAAYAGSVLAGAFFTPLLLPVIPGAAFSWKGWLLGLAWAVPALRFFGWFSPEYWLLAAGYLLLLPSVSAYLAMNFTGSSTYTSPSGVMREMRIALPLIIGSSALGAALVLIKNLMG
jgi:hypothetical protein